MISRPLFTNPKHFTTLGGCDNEDHYLGNCMKAMVRKPIRIAVATVIASLLVYCLPGF